MTENKRFNYVLGEGFTDYMRHLTATEVCDLLNELSEQADAVREELRLCEEENTELQKENEQLKQSYKEFEDECQSTFNAMNRKQNDLYRKNFKLNEENEQLKTQINIFEKFLDENNLDIDWEIFCTVDECKKDSDDYGCKECKYLGVMWND